MVSMKMASETSVRANRQPQTPGHKWYKYLHLCTCNCRLQRLSDNNININVEKIRITSMFNLE